jgi:hypothetical protein
MPAPWTVANASPANRGPIEIKSRHGLHVGTAYCWPDAQIMAAAPEMLAALEAYQAWSDASERAANDKCPANLDAESEASDAFGRLLDAAIAKAKRGAS